MDKNIKLMLHYIVLVGIIVLVLLTNDMIKHVKKINNKLASGTSLLVLKPIDKIEYTVAFEYKKVHIWVNLLYEKNVYNLIYIKAPSEWNLKGEGGTPLYLYTGRKADCEEKYKGWDYQEMSWACYKSNNKIISVELTKKDIPKIKENIEIRARSYMEGYKALYNSLRRE